MVEDPWRQLRQRQKKPDTAARADGEAKGTGGRQQQQQRSIEPAGETKSEFAGELSDSRLDTEGTLDRPWH